MWIWKVARKGAAVSIVASVLGILGVPDAMAQEQKQELAIELNKVEDVAGACHGSFVVYNKLEHSLERLTLDLYLFDPKGIITQHTVLDIGPVPAAKTRIVTFSLIQDKCENLHHMVLNDIPNCVAAVPEEVDCRALVRIWSLSETEFWQ